MIAVCGREAGWRPAGAHSAPTQGGIAVRRVWEGLADSQGRPPEYCAGHWRGGSTLAFGQRLAIPSCWRSWSLSKFGAHVSKTVKFGPSFKRIRLQLRPLTLAAAQRPHSRSRFADRDEQVGLTQLGVHNVLKTHAPTVPKAVEGSGSTPSGPDQSGACSVPDVVARTD